MKPILFILSTLFTVTIFSTAPASAATAESCFEFSNNSITNYYDNEGNDPANPACPRDVEIPATIGGQNVEVIGWNAFYAKQLTSVSIPNTVTEIQDQSFLGNKLTSLVLPTSVRTISYEAFVDNNLTSLTLSEGLEVIGFHVFGRNELTEVTIPNSVVTLQGSAFSQNNLSSVTLSNSLTDIPNDAFGRNNLTEVTIPSSVTSIDPGAFYAQYPSSRDSVDELGNVDYATIIASTRYVRLYASGPNALSLTSGALVYDEQKYSYDFNGDGDSEDILNLGGHLINPAQATTTFENTTGETLRPSQTMVGKIADGAVLTDYRAANGPTVPGMSFEPTPAELEAQQEALASYYRIGMDYTFTAPAIDGYTGPTPASPHTTILAARANNIEFVYAVQGDNDNDDETTPSQLPSPSDPTNTDGELAATGLSVPQYLMIALAIIGTGLGALLSVRYKVSRD